MSSNKIKTIIIVVLALLVIVLAYAHFTKPKNVVITDISHLPAQKTNQLVVNDSTKGTSQTVLITDQSETIKALQTDKQRLLSELVKLKPEYVLQYRESLKQGQVIGSLQDSLSKTIDNLLEAKSDATITKDSFERYKTQLLTKRIPFEITDNKWRFEKGSFDLTGNIRSDSLRIESRPFVTFGHTGGFLKRDKITVVVGNENPLMSQDSLHSFSYKPPKKIQFSFTGIGMSDGKSITTGAGINLKKGILSLTLGYTLFNKQF